MGRFFINASNVHKTFGEFIDFYLVAVHEGDSGVYFSVRTDGGNRELKPVDGLDDDTKMDMNWVFSSFTLGEFFIGSDTMPLWDDDL